MSRRKARELALQLLFQEDLTGRSPEEIRETFWELTPVKAETRDFADRLFRQTVAHRAEIDAMIERFTRHWRLERMSAVDRNILRMAISEFLFSDTPRVVVIDESVEIARKYGTERSSEFVNGILDAVRQELEKVRDE